MSKFNLILPPELDFAQEVRLNVETALREDIYLAGSKKDLTAELISENKIASAKIISREKMILCGQLWLEQTFNLLANDVEISWKYADGDQIKAEETICTIKGNARVLLSGERCALNFIQLLSAVATKTNKYVQLIAGTTAQIVDTRKTLPGLRLAQKYAVLVGGGTNHRLALWDAILLKENHLHAAGSIKAAYQAAKKLTINQHCQFIQLEVEDLQQLELALEENIHSVLLDNFSLEQLKKAVEMRDQLGSIMILEASGGITEANLRQIAETGVDRISLGTLTKDISAIDLSMLFYDL